MVSTREAGRQGLRPDAKVAALDDVGAATVSAPVPGTGFAHPS